MVVKVQLDQQDRTVLQEKQVQKENMDPMVHPELKVKLVLQDLKDKADPMGKPVLWAKVGTMVQLVFLVPQVLQVL